MKSINTQKQPNGLCKGGGGGRATVGIQSIPFEAHRTQHCRTDNAKRPQQRCMFLMK